MNTNQSNHKTTGTGEQESYVEMKLSEFLRAFRKFWWLCLILAVIGTCVMFYRSYLRFSPVYQSSVTFTVQTQETHGSSLNMGITSYSFSYNRATASQLASTFPSIVKSNILQDIICNDLDLPFFPCSLSSSSVPGTNMFTVTATGADPEMTYRVLQSLIENYPSVAEYVIGNTSLYILNQPQIPTAPSNAFSYRSHMVRGALLGFCAGLALIGIYAVLRQTVRSRSDIREKLNRHCCGVLPAVTFKKYNTEIDRSILITNPMVGDAYMESFRACRNSLVSSLGDRKIIMVTSTAPGEGKTTVAVNLAMSLAMMKKDVLLVDLDLRNPNVSTVLGTGDARAEDTQKLIRISNHSLGAGCSMSYLNFNTKQMGMYWKILNYEHLSKFVDTLRREYDYVIIDTSPLGLTSDPVAIAAVADASVFVIREDTIRISRILASLDALQSSADQLQITCVLNGAEPRFDVYGYHRYGYGYSYGYSYGYYGTGYGKEKKHSRRSRSRKASASHEDDEA